MPDLARPGFWQTMPGLMTATAGILSAATGAIVALNQTGVVDLKQVTGRAPAAQTAPAEPQPPAPTNGTPAAAPSSVLTQDALPKSEPTGKKVELNSSARMPTTQEPLPGAPPGTAAEPKPASPDTTRNTVEVGKTQPAPVMPRPQYDPRPQPRSPQVSTAPATDPRERPATGEREEPPPPTGTRREDAAPAGPGTNRASAPTQRPAEPVRTVPTAGDDAARREPDAQSRTVKGRIQDEPPPPPHPAERDTKRPKVLQPEEPRSVGKAKASVADDRKHTQPEAGEKKDKPKADPEKKKDEPAQHSPKAGNSQLALTGLKLTVPAGWVKEEVQPSPMGPVAVFKIPKVQGSDDDGAVRITHYPNMKGKEMDDRNIDRWIGQVAKPDGTPMTRADAKITTMEVGTVRLTVVDLTGAVKMTMRDAAKPNHRMIAAIVDHPQGPHFVVATGPVAAMEKWAAQIDAFLKSAKVQ